MTRLKSDCLLFQTTCGEQIPCSAEWVTLELIGEAAGLAEPEVIRQAAAAVLHYFKSELHRNYVSVAEFAWELERALRGLGLSIFADSEPGGLRVQESNLPELIRNAGENCELFFFPHLRRELHRQLEESPRIVRFNGLRPCVKQLAGADRWSRRCELLGDQIVDYLRTCCQTDTRSQGCTLVVL
ncbi:MAG: hypothetical protein ABSF38_09835 [Verrucomicrobiota bacterium]